MQMAVIPSTGLPRVSNPTVNCEVNNLVYQDLGTSPFPRPFLTRQPNRRWK